MVNIALAFAEGFALVVSPCILPILPIMLSASIDGSKKRPYGIILGFILSFSLFTFFSRQLILLFNIDPNLIRNVSLTLLLLFGVVMLSSYLTEKFNILTQAIANIGFKATNNDTWGGFGGGILFGALVGLIWTPCAGPILAAVIVQSILQHSSLNSFLTILAFGFGAALPMLAIIMFGRTITTKVNFFQRKAAIIRKILGVIIIFAVLYMIYGAGLFVSSNTEKINSGEFTSTIADGVKPYAAPELAGISDWINTKPLTVKELKGKVILIDFWAYSCINCSRTIPYLNDWHKKYHEQGLVIIGVQSPEFDFERDLTNVQKAVKQYGIQYPVALDNQFSTWTAYNNHYWPAHYLIDKNGQIVYTHFGEGSYSVTENNIRVLLGITSMVTDNDGYEVARRDITPETYLGSARGGQDDSTWSLTGHWDVQEAKIISTGVDAEIKLHFRAKKVFAVMGGSGNHKVKVLLSQDGAAVKETSITVNGSNLYTLVDLPELSEGILQLKISEPGLEMYTFTFGG